MFKRQGHDRDVESGGASSEATPLLASNTSSLHAEEEPAPAEYLGAVGAVAPPPAAAPPPPPATDESPGENNEGAAASNRKQHQESSTPLSSSTNNEDNASQSQLSQSAKSGKSGKSRKRRPKKTTDAASAKSGRSAKSKAKKKKREGPQKSICHLLFDAVRYLAIMASAFMLAMQAVPLVVKLPSTWLQIAVRSYLAIFCVSFILTEVRVPLLQRIVLHDNWILKGFLYSFIGLIGMEQDLAVKVEDIAAGTHPGVLGPDYATLFATLFMSITTWIMIGVGILYTGMGLMCMQRWYERLEKDYREKVKEWKQKKKRDEDFRKQKEDYRQYEKDRHEGRAEWYDDLE